MRCGISGCPQEVSFNDSAVHYAQFHQKFTCDVCEEIFFGVKSFTVHPSIKCIRVVKQSDAIETRKASKKSRTRNGKILDWLLRMSEAELDPSSTFSSLDASTTPEACKKKVRYKSTEEAILALIRMEKGKRGLVEQLPYRCNHCKGVHNTHLISRRRLNDLILKYRELQKR
jgi:hypothetical protein